MADKAHILTDQKLEEMEKHLSAIYSDAYNDIQRKSEEYFSKFSEADAKKWKKVESGELSEDEYKKWRKGKIMYGKRFTAMKEDIAKQLLNVNQTATAYINGELPEIYTLNYNALATSVDGVGGYSFTLLDRDTVKHLATTDKSLLPFRELDPAKDIPWNMKAINSEVLQGIVQGESIPDMSKRIFGEIMKTSKTEGLTDKEMGALLKRNRDAAIRSARTIVTGAENKGRMDSFKRAEADGIILQKEWLSSDQPGRTRDWHLPHSFESLVVDIDKPFVNGMGKIMFPGDPSADGANVYNCRCSMASVVKGFKKAQVERAMEENQVTQPKLHTPKTQPREKITQDEWDVLEDYVSGNGMDINNFLRQRNGLSIGDMNASEKARLSLMDKAVSKSELSKDQTLYRNVDASAVFDKSTLQKIRRNEYSEDDLQEVVGKTITDKGFMSTTKDKEIAFGWGDFTGSETPIVLEFETPKGTHGIDLKRFDIEGDEQKEILLDRGLSYDIKSVGTEKMRFKDEYGEYYESCIVVKAKIKKVR